MIIQDTNIDASILKRHGLREVEYSEEIRWLRLYEKR